MRWLIRLSVCLSGWLLPALVLASLLSACSTVQPLQQGERRYYENIAISGRFSVSYEQQGKPQSAQGRFRWIQRGRYIDIDLLSPLGQTMAKISITPGLAKMEQSGQQPRMAIDALELTTQVLGWPLPADGLRDWLQGFAHTATPLQRVASPTGMTEFDADGWQVRYVSWQQQESSVYPKRLDLSHNTAQAGKLGLRLVIDGWEPH